MIVSDILGIFQAFTPKFVKKYANLGAEMSKCSRPNPGRPHGQIPGRGDTYRMIDGELKKLAALRKKQRTKTKK